MDTAVTPHFERTLPAVPASVPQLRHALVDWASALGVDDAHMHAVRLAVSEAVTNAVMHGFIDREPGSVTVTALTDRDLLEVRVTDDGRGMGPRPDSPGLGMGVSLIGRLCTTVDLATGPDGGGTEVRMVFDAPGLRPGPRPDDGEQHLREVLDALSGTLGHDGFGSTDISALAQLLVPRLGDFCSVTLLDADGTARRISASVARPDGTLDADAARWAMEFPVNVAASPSNQAAQSGRTQVTFIDREWCYAVAPDAQRAEELLALGLRWWAAVPLRAGGRAVGSVAIAGRSATPGTVVATVEQIAEQAAGLVATARLVDELRRTQTRLEQILGVLTEAVVVTDDHGRGVYANLAAATLLGAPSIGDLLHGPSGALTQHLIVTDPVGAPLPPDVLPAGLDRSGAGLPRLLRTVDRATGQTRWLRCAATPLEDGPLLVTVIQDATAATADEQRQRLLAQAADLLAASLGRPEVVEDVARLAVPAIADGCVVDLLDDGALRLGGVHHVDPVQAAVLDDLRRRYPPGSAPGRRPRTDTPDDVLASGRPGVLNGLTDGHLRREAHDPAHLDALRKANLRSIATVPLTLHGQLLGTLTLSNDVSGRVFADGDVTLAEDLAHRAAIAVDSAVQQSESARTHAELEESLRRLRVVADAGFGGLIRGVEDRIVEANAAYLDLLGYESADELPPWPQMTPPEWAVADARAVAQLRQTGTADLYEKEYWRRDGTRVRVLIGTTVVDPATFTWIGVVVDVSDRRDPDPLAESGLDRLTLAGGDADAVADVLGGLAVGVLIQQPDGVIIYANQAAADGMGVASPQAMVAASPEELAGGWDTFDEAGDLIDPERYPNAQLLAGARTAGPLTVRSVHRLSGREFWRVIRARAVLGGDGELAMVVSMTEDITEARRAILTQRLLAQAGEVLSASLDVGETLPRLVALVVPELADWASVVMPDGHGAIRQVAVAHTDPAQLPVLAEYDRRWAERLGDPGGAAAILRGEPSSLMADLPDSFVDGATADPEQRAALRRLGLRSVVQVPMAPIGGATLGVLSLVNSRSDRVFTAADLALAEELGRRAGTAVHHARLHAERSHIAATLQASLLPDALPEIDGFALAAGYQPAGEENWVGGDFYDVFDVADGFMAIVGDVAGHGAGAAALTAQARHTLRAIAEASGDPVAAVAHLNRLLVPRAEPALCTVCAVLVRVGEDGGATAAITCAGHPLPCLVRDGVVSLAGEFGPLLGAWESTFTTTAVPLLEGDVLVIYTDGVLDVRAGREHFGEDRLRATLAGSAGATDAVARVQSALDAFGSGPQADDTALLAIERRPAGAAASPRRAAESAP
ncbi:Anti-sigma F factor [Paraconexibacter sp. AEG42_29]|uniref:Anti-sigma F factor n=1 Tax=Paraconexibacter sp. AEG42_29 TaxID=2997339 RepID=A0AAU7AVY4_9ACTN